MKTTGILLFTLLSLSCKNTTEAPETEHLQKNSETKNLNVAEQIAYASGYEGWKDVSEIAFTFNVDRGGKHSERSWIWKPKSGDVTMQTAIDTTIYNRSKLDSLALNADAAFINDKYWLLAPFQIIWDASSITITEKQEVIAPISQDTLNQLTVVYSDEGGYTPGDAYDFFYDEDYKIKEWNYRKKNSQEPTLTTTWEDYKDFNTIEVATKHQDSTGSFTLYFTNISVKKE
ncbi:MAG TPA: hypothetical protein VKX40_06770 [Aequorivita sp.]|nr:hypothetical protein [Aequorivita sp.]